MEVVRQLQYIFWITHAVREGNSLTDDVVCRQLMKLDRTCYHPSYLTHLCSRYPTTTLGLKGPLGSACAGTDDCHVTKSVCFYGVCKCIPGYSYSPRNDICVRRCKEYGDKMAAYPGLAISGHNEMTSSHVPIEECVEACVSEANFLCLSLDTFSNDGRCHLQASGYLDVFTFDREMGQTNWTYFHRDCAV